MDAKDRQILKRLFFIIVQIGKKSVGIWAGKKVVGTFTCIQKWIYYIPI